MRPGPDTEPPGRRCPGSAPAVPRARRTRRSGRLAKTLLVIGGAVAVVTAAALVSLAGVRRGATGPLPTYWEAPRFALVDQTGDTLRSEELLGEVWVASFIFTKCASVCPLITARMAQLRDSLHAHGRLGRDVRLVSLSVDPARDTPPALRDYAARFGGSPPEVWAFLTGSPPDAVRDLVQEGFHLTAIAPARPEADTSSAPVPPPGYQVSHSPRVLLVDREGMVRGIYTGTEPETPARILADIQRLLKQGMRRPARRGGRTEMLR